MMLPFIAALVGGYLLGSIPFGLLLTRQAGLGDIRAIGSGNIGATNVLRTGRKELAAATLVLDAAKGAAAVLIAAALFGREVALVAGLAAVLGHLFPVWLRFRGGKGVATGLGVLIASAWPVGVLACVLWLVVAGMLRRSSLAALIAVLSAPFSALLLSDHGEIVLAAIVAILIWIRHHENIRRLMDGTEPRIGDRSGAGISPT